MQLSWPSLLKIEKYMKCIKEMKGRPHRKFSPSDFGAHGGYLSSDRVIMAALESMSEYCRPTYVNKTTSSKYNTAVWSFSFRENLYIEMAHKSRNGDRPSDRQEGYSIISPSTLSPRRLGAWGNTRGNKGASYPHVAQAVPVPILTR